MMSTSPKPLRRGRWPRATLKDILEAAQLGFACGARDPSGIVQLRMNNVTPDGEMRWDELVRVPPPGNMDSYLLNSGDVLFNNTNSVELVGKTALFCGYSEPVVFSNHFTRLQARRDVILPEFLAFWLRLRWNEGLFAEGCNRWVGQAAFNRNKLMSVQIPLPSLLEQRRIVAVLDEQLAEVDRARAAVEAQLGAARALPEAFLREVFDGPEAKKWPRRSLGSIGDIVTGNTPPRKEAAHYGGNIPWIKPDDLDRSLFVESSTEYLTEEGANRSRMLPAGSVLVSCIGKLGKSAISRTPLATNQQINAIVPNADIDAIYLYYAVKAIVPVMEQLASVTIVPIINKTTFSSITLPVPPTSVQRSIASRLLEQYDQQGRLLAALEAQSSEMSILPAKLLEAAFSGQI